MANYSELEGEVSGLMGVLGVLIEEVGALFTDHLIGLIFIIAILGLIVWFVFWVKRTVQDSTKSMKMK